MLTVPEIRLMPTAYAKDKGKLNSKVEVFSKYNASEIRDDLSKVPEGKQLLAISKMYHTNGATACNIMNEVNPDYHVSGRSWEDIAYDVGYRGSYLTLAGTKFAGVGIALYGLGAVAPVVLEAGALKGLAIGTGSASTVLTAAVNFAAEVPRTAHVLIYGEENETLNKIATVAELTDAVMNIANLCTKPIAGNVQLEKGIKSVDLHKDLLTNVPPEALKKTVERIENTSDLYDILNVEVSVKTILDNLPDQKHGDTLVISTQKTEDGRTETRIGELSLKDWTEADEQKAKSLGLPDSSIKKDDLKKLPQILEQSKASTAVATSKELEKSAEDVADAGGAQYKEMFDVFIDSIRKGLLESILNSGGNIHDLDKLISEAAGKEMIATGIMVTRDEQGNITKASIVGESKDAALLREIESAPFAPSKVAGSYTVYVPKHENRAQVTVKSNGKDISVSYWYMHERNGKIISGTVERKGPFTPTYDPKTGRGRLGEYTFWFTNKGGKMSLNVR
jgi:hypothetical protein